MIERLPNYIKPVAFFSVLMGLIFGVCLVIPIIQLFMIFAFWIVGAVIVHLLKKNNFIGKFTQREGIIIGSIAGMFSVIAASVSFLPTAFLDSLISKMPFLIGQFFTSPFSFFVLLILIFFVGLMNVIFNIGSALLVIWIYDNLEEKKEEQPEFKVEL